MTSSSFTIDSEKAIESPGESGPISKLGSALALARLGYRVFPCWADQKHSRIKGWGAAATSDVEQIRRWWGQWWDSNPGILTGDRAGVLVIDIDGREGLASLAELEAKYGPLPKTRIVISPRVGGGRHFHFQYPSGARIKNSASKIAEHIDIRAGHSGAAGLAIGPGSINQHGRAYRWASGCGPETPLASLPATWIELLSDKPEPPAPLRDRSTVDEEKRYRRCRAYLKRLPPSNAGENGHAKILRVACEIIRFDLSDSDAMDLLKSFPADPKWSESELLHKLVDAKKLVGNQRGCKLLGGAR